LNRRKQPTRISGPLERLTADLAPATPLASVQSAWRSAVGDRIADSCVPEGEKEGILTVVCETSVWAQQLSMMQEELLKKLADQLPGQEDVPRELRFVVAS